MLFAAAAARAVDEGGARTPCSATVSLEPDRAVAGQQVLYRVEILRFDDGESITGIEPPSFPSIRSERLPGSPERGQVGGEGARHRLQEERFALFPERTGQHVLRAPELRCTAAGGAEAFRVRVPDAQLRVEPPPAAGRPEGFDGLVGPLSLGVTVTPREMRVGESVRVATMLRGAGNLWDAVPPFDSTSFGGAEVFALRPRLALERGHVLHVRRHYGYDVVPGEAGLLIVPPVRVPYFDPESGSYAVATSEPVVVRVAEREGAGSGAREGGGGESSVAPPAAAVAPRSGPRSSSVVAWLAGLAALLVLALAIGLRLLRRRRAGAGEALERAAQARREGDAVGEAAALEGALRLALARVVPDARTVTAEALIARESQSTRVRRAAELMAALERSRFDPAAPPPDAAAVVRAIDALN
jgi:hypothetical protein